MDIQITAKTANNSHLVSLIELGRMYYPAGHSVLTGEFLKWFYLDNPAGPATLIVAEGGSLWVGLIALIPIVLECHGKLQKACFAVNVLTHPDHRTKNLFVKMIKCARQSLTEQGVWLLGHPNANAVPGWKRQKMDFRDPLHLYLAKFNWILPFRNTRRICSLEQLRELPSDFWQSLTDRPDTHLKYTPEFIAWRFLDAPHRKYVVSAVESRGNLLGLRVTRRFKGPVDLLVDFVAPVSMLGDVLSSVSRPTLIMHSGLGCTANGINRGCWKLPFKRVFPFFVTTWDSTSVVDDLSGITLVASDF